MTELRLLGTVELTRAGGGAVQSVTVQPKRLALLAYLAAARPAGPHRRDTLLALLWPELDDARARAALNKALHHLRQSLGAEAIVSRGEEAVELDGGVVGSDVARFEEAVGQGEAAAALELYGGDLLHGFHLSDAPDFERWMDGERTRLQTAAARAALELSARCEAAGDLPGAIHAGRRALGLSGRDEPAVRRLMSLLDDAGNRAGAIEAYDVFTAELRRDLELEPAPETQELAQRIRGRASATVTPLAARTLTRSAAEAAPLETAAAAPAATGSRTRIRARTGAFAAAGAAVVLLAVGAIIIVARGAAAGGQSPLEPRRVLVVPFDDHTRDAALAHVGRMAADWITDGVSRMGGFEVVPSSAVWATASGATGADGSGGGMDVRRLAHETGAGTVLSGSYYVDGDNIILQARAHDARTGRVVRPVGGVAVARDSLVHGIDRLRARVLAALAPVGDTIYHLRMAAPPPSYEAYREYIIGMGAFVTGDPALALRHYERAAAADADWAMPRIAAAIMHMNLGRIASADSLLAPLDRARERLGPLEHATLRMVLGMMRGDQKYVYDAAIDMAAIAPGTINEYMVAEMARKLNRPAEAIAVLERMGAERGELRGWRPHWRELTWSHHMLGEHERELAAARRARALHPHDDASLALEVTALAALGRVGAVRERIDERIASASGAAPDAGELMRLAARELTWHGYEDAGVAFAARAVAWYEDQHNEPHTRGLRRSYARALIDARRYSAAEHMLRALREEGDRDPRIIALHGIALAGSGRAAEAAAASQEAAAYAPPHGLTGPLDAVLGEHTFLRAAIAARLGDTDAALRLLREAEAHGLRFSPDFLCSTDLRPLRGDARFDEWRRPRQLPARRRPFNAT